MRWHRRITSGFVAGFVLAALAQMWVTDRALADGGCDLGYCWPPSPPKGAIVVQQDLDSELPGAVSKEPQANSALAADKAIAASCPNCYWAVQQECIFTGESCSSVVTNQCGPRNSWPGDESWTRWVIYFAQPPPTGAGNYSPVGDFCAPGGADPSLAAVREAFRELAQDFPTPEVNYQPSWGTLVNLDTRFWTPMPTGLGDRALTVNGHQVTVTVHVRWVWVFGDGGGGTFYVPGGPYPDAGVTHAYKVPGRGEMVTVAAQYTGVYNGVDLGVVVEKVSPGKGIDVLTARAELTDPRNP